MKLSVVTINYNNAIGLQKTIDSVAAQTYKEFEHIIVDGNSNDEGVRIIQEYDYAQRSSCQPHPVIRCQNWTERTSYKATRLRSTTERRSRIRVIGRSEITMSDIMQGKFLHQASFCRRDLFERYGYIDDSYAIVADKKFFINCMGFHDASFKYVDINVANFDVNGISSATEGPWYEKHEEEYKRMQDEMFPKRLKTYMEENEELEELRKHKWVMNVTSFLLRLVK